MATNNEPTIKNIFQEGKFAHGDSFIGRQKLLSEMMRSWKESNGSGTYSIIGLNRMGKTSLVHEFRDRVKKTDASAICIIVSLSDNTLPNLIQLIMSMILRESDCLDDESKRLCQETCEITFDINPVLKEREVVLNYIELLNHFGEINQRFMLIIDEFDSAKIVWKNKISYFEGIRDSVQYPGFFILVSRRPLEVIEMDSYGSSCFHNVFTELHVCAFDKGTDMEEYYHLLSTLYGIELKESERERIEEYSGFCPTILAGLGKRLASASINHQTQPLVEDIFLEQSFRTNYIRHYSEFLKRMTNDGSWDDLVQIIMDISSIRIEPDSEDSFREATINKLCCRGYLRQKSTKEYIVFSEDFSAWARNKLYHNEIQTIYSRIILAEVAIRELLKEKMPIIWNNQHPGLSYSWENDFLTNSSRVPNCVKHFTSPSHSGNSSSLNQFLRTARRYDPSACVADALSMKVKIALLKEYWRQGISASFNSEPYSNWEDSFDKLEKIRNPLFHAMITPNVTTTHQFFLLRDVNEQADRIIQQLST